MNKRDEFLKSQKILRLATLDKNNTPHIVPVWYIYRTKKIYIGTNTRTQKANNLKKNKHVTFCVDVGINAPNIFGVMGKGKANLILDKTKVKKIATKILLRYFKNMKNKSAVELLEDTDCIIEIIPEKFSDWSY
ncbi:MAG TPA: pyridoxamine 5'-phosphate oxidase family protein [Nitrosopumilaceae archaeon]|jgi:nitroimidazol reductase NimA-like FMN-containing flavoprotein (pyridoxamine 5'-phosphate oxidase superfamily)|nr:pyridoxamine 5'-phosphate oxidase family protein [Nitrosopumilaceae archaeon]